MSILRSLWTRFLLAHSRTSDKEIRTLFSYVAQIDSCDFVEIYPGVTLIGYAAFVHVRTGSEQFTISTSLTGQMVVQELGKNAEKIHKSYPHFPVKSRWRYVYRSGELVKSVRFVGQLRMLKRAIYDNHRAIASQLEAIRYVVADPDDETGSNNLVLDECCFDAKYPGFLLRNKEKHEVFHTMTYAEAVQALKEAA